MVSFDEHEIFCSKGVEINFDTGDTKEEPIKRGINQLQYAIPRFLCDQILFNIFSHKEDNHPFSFCPILVTTAKLYRAKNFVTKKQIEQAQSIAGIATEIPFLITISDYGPDFENHFKMTASELAKKEVLDHVKSFQLKPKYDFLAPETILKELASASRYHLTNYCNHFIVCNFEYLPLLVNRIKKVTVKAIQHKDKSRKSNK